ANVGEQKAAVFTADEIRALGDACVLPLTRYLQSPNSFGPGQDGRRVQAAEIVADLAQPRSIPDLIDLLGHSDGEVRYCAARALKRLTRETQGRAADWWRTGKPEAREQARKDWQA